LTGTLVLAQISKEELQKEILHTWEAAKHTWVIPIHIGPVDLSINKIIWFLFLGAAISFLVLYVGARLLKDRPGAYQVVVEELYGFGRNYLGGQIGEAGMKWFPYTLSIFVFLLTLNIIGLFPGSYPVTSNLSFTATLALITFILTHYMGIKRNGAGAYFRSWVPEGLPARVFMAPFMFFIHTISGDSEAHHAGGQALRQYPGGAPDHLRLPQLYLVLRDPRGVHLRAGGFDILRVRDLRRGLAGLHIRYTHPGLYRTGDIR